MIRRRAAAVFAMLVVTVSGHGYGSRALARQNLEGTSFGQLSYEGRNRTYVLHVPAGLLNGEERVPLVVALHGGGSRAEGVDRLTHFFSAAEHYRFIVV